MKFREKLKELRKEKGLTQEGLASMIGVSKRAIVGYESGSYYPRNHEMYRRLAESFDVDVNYLLTEDEDFDIHVAMKYGKSGKDQAHVFQVRGILDCARELFSSGSLSTVDEIAFLHEILGIFLDSKGYNRDKFKAKGDEEHAQVL